MLTGLERPTSGQVFLSGASAPTDRLRRARAIQMVFQDPYASLTPRQTVGAGLHELLRLHKDDRTRHHDRAAELLDQVGLDDRIVASYPGQLSGGQRVAIARALAPQPAVLVLDEAVSALDVSVQAQVLCLLADLREQLNVSYVFVTHDLAVVQQITDQVLVMHRGRVVEQGQTDQLLSAPEHPYTRSLLDAVPRAGWRPELAPGGSASRRPRSTGTSGTKTR
ncbi:ABC transporter ATP-binding protein [Streptomyces sp. NPDC056653]|uniref:ABC transporter ATP-binding protein n=1 Tax=Streptomyces sp. NPDC056653 TaxID=3345894 RepID=UPI0036A59704